MSAPNIEVNMCCQEHLVNVVTIVFYHINYMTGFCFLARRLFLYFVSTRLAKSAFWIWARPEPGKGFLMMPFIFSGEVFSFRLFPSVLLLYLQLLFPPSSFNACLLWCYETTRWWRVPSTAGIILAEIV